MAIDFNRVQQDAQALRQQDDTTFHKAATILYHLMEDIPQKFAGRPEAAVEWAQQCGTLLTQPAISGSASTLTKEDAYAALTAAGNARGVELARVAETESNLSLANVMTWYQIFEDWKKRNLGSAHQPTTVIDAIPSMPVKDSADALHTALNKLDDGTDTALIKQIEAMHEKLKDGSIIDKFKLLGDLKELFGKFVGPLKALLKASRDMKTAVDRASAPSASPASLPAAPATSSTPAAGGPRFSAP